MYCKRNKKWANLLFHGANQNSVDTKVVIVGLGHLYGSQCGMLTLAHNFGWTIIRVTPDNDEPSTTKREWNSLNLSFKTLFEQHIDLIDDKVDQLSDGTRSRNANLVEGRHR